MLKKKGTPSSVTQKSCRCGTLERDAAHPDIPVVFDKKTNEFSIRFKPENGNGELSMIVYHCWFCGGLAPESARESLFKIIPNKEKHRLVQLTRSIKTIEDAITVLGQPDFDGDTIVDEPEKHKTPPHTQAFRCLYYYNLSDTAWIMITEREDKSVRVDLYGQTVNNKEVG